MDSQRAGSSDESRGRSCCIGCSRLGRSRDVHHVTPLPTTPRAVVGNPLGHEPPLRSSLLGSEVRVWHDVVQVLNRLSAYGTNAVIPSSSSIATGRYGLLHPLVDTPAVEDVVEVARPALVLRTHALVANGAHVLLPCERAFRANGLHRSEGGYGLDPRPVRRSLVRLACQPHYLLPLRIWMVPSEPFQVREPGVCLFLRLSSMSLHCRLVLLVCPGGGDFISESVDRSRARKMLRCSKKRKSCPYVSEEGRDDEGQHEG